MPRAVAGEALLRVLAHGAVRLRPQALAQGRRHAGHEIVGVVDQPGHPLHGRRCLVYIPLHCGQLRRPAGPATRRCACEIPR